jgi:dienelactone hydrolase
VIIGNSGGDPHDGFARFSVEFGRRLAQLGIASLRMDFAGLGDSVNGQDDREGATHTFEVDRTRDFGAAIDIVESLGFVHIALQGSCSGAYHALRGAVADRRVTALLSINLPWFTLRYEKAGPQSGARQMISNLAERRTRCLLFYAEGDPGVNALERHFGEEGQELAGWEGCSVSILSGLDHDLTAPEMRKRAGDHLIAFLRQDQQWVRERGLALEAVGRQADMSTVHPVMMLGEK